MADARMSEIIWNWNLNLHFVLAALFMYPGPTAEVACRTSHQSQAHEWMLLDDLEVRTESWVSEEGKTGRAESLGGEWAGRQRSAGSEATPRSPRWPLGEVAEEDHPRTGWAVGKGPQVWAAVQAAGDFAQAETPLAPVPTTDQEKEPKSGQKSSPACGMRA